MNKWISIFLLFIKVNLLTTSGPASVGLLYKEAVGTLMTESEFVEAVGFSNILPGSDALQLALFVGYAAGGVPGALLALLGSILPPTVLMLAVASILHRLRAESWLTGFMRGLTPAVAVLMVVVAWQIFKSAEEYSTHWATLVIAGLSLIALLCKVPSPLVLLGAGILGVLILK